MRDRWFSFGALKAASLGAILVFGSIFAAQAQVLVVTFGDSGPAGDGVLPAQGYPAVLQAALRAKGIQATVQNISVSGNTTAMGFSRVGSVPANAKVVITEFGSNDLRAGVGKADMHANMDAIVKRLRANGAQVLIMGTRGINYDDVASKNGAMAFSYPASFKQYIQSTGKHLTPEGHAAAVALILPKVQELITRAK
jgi:lysophospholipase L1-like esterase